MSVLDDLFGSLVRCPLCELWERRVVSLILPDGPLVCRDCADILLDECALDEDDGDQA